MQYELLNSFLEQTVKHGATDLHICVGSPPLMRINSKLQKLPGTLSEAVEIACRSEFISKVLPKRVSEAYKQLNGKRE